MNTNRGLALFEEVENLRELHVDGYSFPAGTRFAVVAVAVHGLCLAAMGHEFWLPGSGDAVMARALPQGFQRAITMPAMTSRAPVTGWESDDGDPKAFSRLSEWAQHPSRGSVESPTEVAVSAGRT